MYNSEAEVDSSLSFQKSSEAIRIARHALECVDSVSLFTDVVRDPQIEAFVDILHAIAHEGSLTNSLRYRFFGLIADAVVNDPPLLARVSSQAPGERQHENKHKSRQRYFANRQSPHHSSQPTF